MDVQVVERWVEHPERAAEARAYMKALVRQTALRKLMPKARKPEDPRQ